MRSSTSLVVDQITAYVLTGRVDEVVLKEIPFVQPWATPAGAREIAKSHLDPFAEHMAAVAHQVVARTGRRATVIADVKPLASIHDKLDRWAQDPKNANRHINTMGDALRGTILVHDLGDMHDLHKHLYDPSAKVEIKNRGEEPNFGYYGSHHFDLKTAGGITAEVQVMHHRLYEGKHVLHKIYDHYRNPANRRGVDPMLIARHMKLSRVGFVALNGGHEAVAQRLMAAVPNFPEKPKEPRDPDDTRVLNIHGS